MRGKLVPLGLALALLAGCGERAGLESPIPAESDFVEEGFVPHAVDEAALREEYAAEGYELVKLTPYWGDYVAEVAYSGDSGSYSTYHMVDWVYGRTGRRLRLETIDGRGAVTYEVTGPGRVRFDTCYYRIDALYKTVPQSWEVAAQWDEEGKPYNLAWSGVERRELAGAWLDPREPYYTGPWDLEEGKPLTLETPEGGPTGPGSQLYDARVTVDGLAFSFLPPTSSEVNFHCFFGPMTLAPAWETDFEAETGRFVLRLRGVCLSSGAVPEEWEAGEEYRGFYPCDFPEGPLGRDSHFLTGVELHADGEDVVVSGYLTERAGSFTVEQGNLGEDTVPALRVVFREQEVGGESGE